MKRIVIVFLFFLVMQSWSFAQKTKTLNVAPMGYLNITAEIVYQSDNVTPKDTVYSMVGVDNQFNYSQKYDQYKRIPIATGSFQRMYNIMQSTLNLFNEEVGVNLTKYDVKMSLRKPTLIKLAELHCSNPDDNGYTILTKEDVNEIILRMENYSERHKVALKKWK